MAEDDVVVSGKLLEWGNSVGLRLRKADLEEAGLNVGEEVIVHLSRKPAKVDLSAVPAFERGGQDDAARHDELLGEARSAARKLRGRGA